MGSYAAKRSQPRCTENNEDHFEMARMEDWERELHQELNTSYDGKLIWRMENYKAHRREAIDQNIIYQTSFPCYTHRFGYKYCLRAHLHGLDGHLTISLVQMSTRFDNALAWPVNHRIRITLVCQRDHNKNKVRTFDGNEIQRPHQKMMTLKCWAFVHPIASLETDGFVLWDRMFIKLEIESITRSILF